MTEISDIFEAHPRCVAEFMRQPGQAFYIPAYQREYSWGTENIVRLFDDVAHGVELLLTQDDAITFIGTLITIHDRDSVTSDPLVQVPTRVMTVIDGQQRLTTLLLMNIALHDELSSRHTRFAKRTGEAELWLYHQCIQTQSDLIHTIEEDMTHGDGDYRYYPRMTRAYCDRWSRKASDAIYDSEIAYLLHQYGSYARKSSGRRFQVAGDTTVRKSFGLVRSTLRKAIARGDHEQIDYPSTTRIGTSRDLMHVLFNGALPGDFCEYLESGDQADFEELFRLLVFARFLLTRVAVTVVTAKSEDYAFDMFESLNTTGEPLTAIETFKPIVIREETLAGYSSSVARSCMGQVDDYIGKFRPERRQAITSGLLVPFALAESGIKLSKHLNSQRRYLRDRFETLCQPALDEREKLAFLQHLANTTRFLQGVWHRSEWGLSEPSLEGEIILSSIDKVCLDLLRLATHTIAIAPLARFYSARREGHEVAIDEAIRAVAAFFALWRGAKGGTAGIDDKYRHLMSHGLEARDVPRLARIHKAQPVAEDLRKYFRARLEEADLGSRELWIEAATETPVYDRSKPLTRFLLLAAMHDTIPDEQHPGVVKQGRSGVLDLLNYRTWVDETMVTVEHVAPQYRDEESDWSDSLYEDADLKHRLGNLLLLPGSANASLSNKPWPHKREIFRYLAAKSPDEAAAIEVDAKGKGWPIPAEITKMQSYLSLTASVAAHEGEWDADIVDLRSTTLAGLAWDNLAPWLGWTKQ